MALVAAGCLTLLFAALIRTDETWGGRVIWRISETHGVHVRDVPIAVVWALGLLCCAALTRRQP